MTLKNAQVVANVLKDASSEHDIWKTARKYSIKTDASDADYAKLPARRRQSP
jgi:hypothetical protein